MKHTFFQNAWGSAGHIILVFNMAAFQFTLAYLLDPTSYGRVTIVLGIAYLAAAVINVGPDNVIIHLLSRSAESAEARLEGREEATKALLGKMALGILGMSPFLFGINWLADSYGIAASNMWCAPLLVPLVWWHLGGVAIANATDRNQFAMLSHLVFFGCHVGAPVILAVSGHLNVTTVLWGVVAARLVASLYITRVIVKIFLIRSWSGIFRLDRVERFFAFGTPAWSNAFFSTGILLIVGRVISVESAGYFRLATAIVKGITMMFPVAPNLVLATIRRYASENNLLAAKKYILIIGGLALFVGLAGIAGVLTVGRWMFAGIYGANYSAVFPMVVWLSWAVLPLIVKNILESASLVYLPPRTVAVIHGGLWVLGFPIAALTTSLWGLSGAVFVYVLCAWGLLIVSVWFLRRPTRSLFAGEVAVAGGEGGTDAIEEPES